MGKNILNFVASNFMVEFRDTLRPYLLIFFGLVGSVAIGYAIYLGFLLARAEDNEKRKKAKKRILMTLSSLMIVIILTVVFVDWDPGEVHDNFAKAEKNPNNYYLKQASFPANAPILLDLHYFGNSASGELTWTVSELPSKASAASVTYNETTGEYKFSYTANPQIPEEIYDFTLTVTVVRLVDYIPVTVTVKQKILVYNPAIPVPANPNTPSQADPAVNPGVKDPAITPGGPTPPPTGTYGFGSPVPLSGSQTPASVINSQFWLGGACTCWGCNKPGMSGRPSNMRPHQGVDISRGFSNKGGLGLTGNVDIYAMSSGNIVHAVSNQGSSNTGWGNYVVIRHESQIGGKYVYSLYAHLASVLKSSGGVNQGDRIGIMGTSGNSTGVHLHWELGFSSSATYSGMSSMSRVCPCCYY